MESIDNAELQLELLGDQYARELMNRLSSEPQSAPDLVDRCSFSRTTVYRRLDQLESAGLVEAQLELRRDGNHRQVYRLAVEQITFSLGDDGGQENQHPVQTV